MIVRRLGRMAYADALTLQTELVTQRARGEIDDHLLIVEHPHTYTLGSSAKPEHLLLTPDQLTARGVVVHKADRGGDITYHGLGQVVAYPILQLERTNARADILGYVRGLEQVVIQVLADYGIDGLTIPGLTGVWVETPRGVEKIAALGVRVTAQLITKHGFALNVAPDLSYFDGIIPCGIRDKGVTSLAALGVSASMDAVIERVIVHARAKFQKFFHVGMDEGVG